jgi:hypothetical protein
MGRRYILRIKGAFLPLAGAPSEEKDKSRSLVGRRKAKAGGLARDDSPLARVLSKVGGTS